MIMRFIKSSVIISLILMTAQGFANFSDTYGISPLGIARGNAMCSIVNDWSSAYYNIAGLGRTKDRNSRFQNSPVDDDNKLKLKAKKQGDAAEKKPEIAASFNDEFALSYIYAHPMFQFDHPSLSIENKEYESGHAVIGLVLDLNHFYKMPSFISSSRFGLAMGTNLYYNRADGKFDATLMKIFDSSPQRHNYVQYGTQTQRLEADAGMGLGFLNDFIGIGFGATVLACGEGNVLAKDVGLGTEPSVPASNSRTDLKPAFAPLVGLYVNPISLIQVGVAYRGQIDVEIDPFATIAIINGESGGEIAELSLGIAIYDYFTPETYSAGVTVNLFMFDISVDCEYQRWSEFTESSSRKKYYEARGLKLPEFRDIIIPKVGATLKLFDSLRFHAGYYYKMSVIKDEPSSGNFNYMDNDKHVVSAGLTFILPRMGIMVSPLEINLACQYQILVDREVEKYDSSESNAVYFEDYSYGGSVLAVSLGIITRW